MSAKNPTERFTKTVDKYVKYRPSYPEGIFTFLENEIGFSSKHTVADIGSGTGILTKDLLLHGNKVYSVEPNNHMRNAADEILEQHNNLYFSIDGTAESTKLEDKSIDFIFAAQAFHWFNHTKARQEFSRVLRNDGWVVLLWNMRNNHASSFMQDYEDLLIEFGTDYQSVAAENVTNDTIKEFFHPNGFQLKTFKNKQLLDKEGFLGRLLSTSYIPKPNTKDHKRMLDKANTIFAERSNKYNKVELVYDAKCYIGKL